MQTSDTDNIINIYICIYIKIIYYIYIKYLNLVISLFALFPWRLGG
jgi:hypothetical protein